MIKVSTTKDMQELIENRALELNISNPEYLRILANLDIAMQRYQQLTFLINLLYNKILKYQKILDIHCAPILEMPMINMEKVSINGENNVSDDN